MVGGSEAANGATGGFERLPAPEHGVENLQRRAARANSFNACIAIDF
jgi:hypothetical protein